MGADGGRKGHIDDTRYSIEFNVYSHTLRYTTMSVSRTVYFFLFIAIKYKYVLYRVWSALNRF